MAGLKMGRWAEKEVACEKLSDLLEQKFKNKYVVCQMHQIIFPYGFKFGLCKTLSTGHELKWYLAKKTGL